MAEPAAEGPKLECEVASVADDASNKAPATSPEASPAAAAPVNEASNESKPEAAEDSTPAAADAALDLASSPVEELKAKLPAIFKAAGIEGHTASIWGVTLDSSSDSKAQDTILQKFLDARNGDISAAGAQLTGTLTWRAQFKPEEAAEESFPPELFDGLGVILPGRTKDGEPVTLNLYGEIKDQAAVFGDLERFLRWRVGLMEKGIAMLSFDGTGQSQMVQIHDYEGVSLFGRHPASKKAASEASKIFSDYYPELLSQKYFVNVPSWAAFVFKIFSTFLSQRTLLKFTVLGPNKAELHAVLGKVMDDDVLPERYGGKGKER